MSKEVGKRIRSLRLRLGLNQKEFSSKLDATSSAVRNWEKGRNKPNAERLKKIAKLGDMSVDELLYGDKETNDLTQLIEQWGADKGLMDKNPFGQLGKVKEEVLEVEQAMENKDMENLIEELGDVQVTITILAKQYGLNIDDCAKVAYDKIKDRTGRTIGDTFVKEEDLPKDESYEKYQSQLGMND